MVIGKLISILSIYESESDKENGISLMSKAGYILDESGKRKFSKEELADLEDDSEFKPNTDYLYCIYNKKVSVSD